MAAQSQVTTYQELQDHIADTLLRSDITTVITTFIQMAEAKFKRKYDFRKLSDRGDFSISADGSSLPSDFQSLESWYHAGPTFFGPIEIKNADAIANLNGSRYGGSTGPPAHAALVDGTARYAPPPDATYTTQFIYWRKITPLGTSNTTNWLLTDHPDLYIYGALAHSAPYLKDDARVQLWKALHDEIAEELTQASEEEQFSGSLRRTFKSIGERGRRR